MNTLIYCLIAAALLPYLVKIPVAVAMNRLGGYDNNHPRDQQAKLQGFGARALAAHQNAFESLIVFSAAILLAIATDTVNESVQLFCNFPYRFSSGLPHSIFGQYWCYALDLLGGCDRQFVFDYGTMFG